MRSGGEHRLAAGLCTLSVAAATTLLASCGGGGGDGSASGDPTSLPASSTLAEVCAAPRAAGTTDPLTGRAYGDTQGTVADEKNFLRSWIDETYLWYQDVRALPAATLDPSGYATAKSYFAALRSPLTTVNGARKDKFHFTYDTPAWVALAQSGISYGYGFEIALISSTVPRNATIAFTTPGAPEAGQLSRGTVILTVDGADVVNGTDTATLNAGLFPAAAGPHSFVVRDAGSTALRTLTLNARQVTSVPVQNVRTLPAPNDQVGYLLFNDHIATAEAQLVNAVNTLKAANVTDLVLDIRYNGGGYLDIAAELAYMIAGPVNTAGKVFEKLAYNDRNPFTSRTTAFLSNSPGIRGGLQAVPHGQYDAADALGLSYWKKNALIILPQAIRHVIPPLVNTFIAFFKDTSLVLIIGIFDLLTTAKTSIIDPAWQSFSVEVYIFVSLIYFAFCFAMSRYSRQLEAQARSN